MSIRFNYLTIQILRTIALVGLLLVANSFTHAATNATKAEVRHFIERQSTLFSMETTRLRQQMARLNCPIPAVEVDNLPPGRTINITVENHPIIDTNRVLEDRNLESSSMVVENTLDIVSVYVPIPDEMAVDEISSNLLDRVTRVPVTAEGRRYREELVTCHWTECAEHHTTCQRNFLGHGCTDTRNHPSGSDREWRWYTAYECKRRRKRATSIHQLAIGDWQDLTELLLSGVIGIADSGINMQFDKEFSTMVAIKPGAIRPPNFKYAEPKRLPDKQRSPCGTQHFIGPGEIKVVEPRIGTPISQTSTRPFALKVTGIHLPYGQLADNEIIDMIRFDGRVAVVNGVGQPTASILSIEPQAVIEGAPKPLERDLIPETFRAEVNNSALFHLLPIYNGIGITPAATGIGSGSLQLIPLGQSEPQLKPSRSLALSEATLELGPAAPTTVGKTKNGAIIEAAAPMGTPIKVQVKMRGPVAAKRYKIRWLVRDFNLQDVISVTSEFTPSADGMAAKAELLIPKDELQTTLAKHGLASMLNETSDLSPSSIFSVQATLIGPHGENVSNFDPRFITLLTPALDTGMLKLGGYRGDIKGNTDPGPFDIFLSNGNKGVTLGIDLLFAGAPLHFNNLGVEAPWLAITQEGDTGLQFANGVIKPAADADPGRVKIMAMLRPDAAARKRIALADPSKPLVSNVVEFTLNRVHLVIEPGVAVFVQRVVVQGPANMSNYQAVWRTSAGESSRSFRNLGSNGWSAEMEVRGHVVVQEIAITDRDNKVVATIKPENTTTIAPLVTLNTPENYVQGEIYPLQANIANLPFKIGMQSYCRITLEPGYGHLSANEVPVLMNSTESGQCNVEVRMDEARETVGKFPWVEVRVKTRGGLLP